MVNERTEVRGGTFVHLAVNHDRLAAMAQLGRLRLGLSVDVLKPSRQKFWAMQLTEASGQQRVPRLRSRLSPLALAATPMHERLPTCVPSCLKQVRNGSLNASDNVSIQVSHIA